MCVIDDKLSHSHSWHLPDIISDVLVNNLLSTKTMPSFSKEFIFIKTQVTYTIKTGLLYCCVHWTLLEYHAILLL